MLPDQSAEPTRWARRPRASGHAPQRFEDTTRGRPPIVRTLRQASRDDLLDAVRYRWDEVAKRRRLLRHDGGHQTCAASPFERFPAAEHLVDTHPKRTDPCARRGLTRAARAMVHRADDGARRQVGVRRLRRLQPALPSQAQSSNVAPVDVNRRSAVEIPVDDAGRCAVEAPICIA